MIADLRELPLYHQMTSSYGAAFAHGTLINRARQARTYLSFMFTYTFPHLNPTVLHILLYAQFLANSYKNLITTKNYLSGAKTYITHAGGDASPFLSPQLTNMLRGLARASLHIPEQAPVIPINYIKAMCHMLEQQGAEGRAARAAILIGYATLLRQSNLLPTPGSGQHHVMTRQDVIDDGPVMWVNINSSKTICDPRQRVSIPVPMVNSLFCPVRAWREYAKRVPLPPGFPAFMVTPTAPLTPDRLNTIMRMHLTALKMPQAHRATVHSLRRSAAQHCAKDGAPQAHLMTHGTWTSQAINSYVPKRLYTSVPRHIHNILGHL